MTTIDPNNTPVCSDRLSTVSTNETVQSTRRSGSWKGHMISLLRGATCRTADVKRSLIQTYGDVVANIIDKVILEHAGDVVSSDTVREAQQGADYCRQKFMERIIHQEFESVCKAAQLPMNAFTNGERSQLRREVEKAIKNETASVQQMTTFGQMRAIAKSVVEAHLRRKLDRFKTEFPHLSAVARQPDGKDVSDQKVALEALKRNSAGPFLPETKQAIERLQNALESMTSVGAMLSHVPISDHEIADYNAKLKERMIGLVDLQHELAELSQHSNSQIGDFAMAIFRDINLRLQQIVEKKEYLKGFQENRPLSANDVQHAKETYIKAAISVLVEEHARDQLTGEQRKLYRQLQTQLEAKNLHGEKTDSNPNDWAIKGDKGARARFEKELVRKLEQAGISADNGMSVKERFQKAHSDALNKMDWSPIETQVQFTLDGQMLNVNSRVTPARHVAGPNDPLTKSYVVDGINGVSSESDHVENHALNCATSKLWDGDREIFSGVRHGIHSTRGLPNGSEQRRQANQEHAKEAVLVALHNDKNLLQEAIEKARKHPPEAVTLTATSLSLVTPSALNDKQHWENQLQAWQDINGQEHEFDVMADDGKLVTVRVKPNVLAFNFGVNPLAMAKGSSIDAIGWGWELADRTNEQSLETLLGGLSPDDPAGGLVKEYLSRDNVSAADRRIVLELARQVRQIWTDRSYRHREGDVYKMNSRLAVLTHLIGATAMWNCRSGKDRTGHLDAEAKMLAAEIYFTGKVPDYGELSDERKRMFTEFALHTGNLEIQQYNTGLPGYKTYNIPDNLDRLASDSAKTAYTSAGMAVPH